jgi:hypothetical protein
LFNAVWYGDRVADAADYQAVVALDDRLRADRPALGVSA